MNRAEHLLVRAMEECDEVSQRVSKALVFGLEEVQPGQGRTNRQRIVDEFHDLVAVLEMAGLHPRSLDDAAISAKKAKVEKYLAYSRECGTLQPDAPAGHRAAWSWPPRVWWCDCGCWTDNSRQCCAGCGRGRVLATYQQAAPPPPPATTDTGGASRSGPSKAFEDAADRLAAELSKGTPEGDARKAQAWDALALWACRLPPDAARSALMEKMLDLALERDAAQPAASPATEDAGYSAAQFDAPFDLAITEDQRRARAEKQQQRAGAVAALRVALDTCRRLDVDPELLPFDVRVDLHVLAASAAHRAPLLRAMMIAERWTTNLGPCICPACRFLRGAPETDGNGTPEMATRLREARSKLIEGFSRVPSEHRSAPLRAAVDTLAAVLPKAK